MPLRNPDGTRVFGGHFAFGREFYQNHENSEEKRYTVKPTTQFKKDYKRAIKRGRKIELLEKLVWQMKTAKGVAHHPIRWWSDALFLFVDKKGEPLLSR